MTGLIRTGCKGDFSAAFSAFIFVAPLGVLSSGSFAANWP